MMTLIATALAAATLFPVNMQRDIAYTRGAAHTLKLDLYEPDAPQLKHRPAVVVLHGGGFTRGHKASPEGLAEFCQALASRGYVCASIDYRLEQDNPPTPAETLRERTVTAAVHDTATAIRWLRKNAKRYSIDPDRFAVAGHSAGAALAMRLAYSDVGRKLGIRAVISMSGALGRDLIRQGDAALCIVHGRQDSIVPIAKADALAESARRAGVPYELDVLEGTGHGTMTSLDRDVDGKSLLQHVLEFLRVHMQNVSSHRTSSSI